MLDVTDRKSTQVTSVNQSQINPDQLASLKKDFSEE